MQFANRVLLITGLVSMAFVASGCTNKPKTAPETTPPTVTVSKPIERNVTDYVDFTGQTDAIFFTEVRPRVTGYLVGMPFKEGAIVKKDQVSFEMTVGIQERRWIWPKPVWMSPRPHLSRHKRTTTSA